MFARFLKHSKTMGWQCAALALAVLSLSSACADDTQKSPAPIDSASAVDATAGDSSDSANADVTPTDGLIADGDAAAGPTEDGTATTDWTDAASAADALPDAATTATPLQAEGIAVAGSDFKTTTISWLDPLTGAVHPHVLDSGSVVTPAGAALSGDVVIAQQASANHLIVLIDRSTGVLTWYDAQKGAVVQQLNVATGFYANPQDYSPVDAHLAYVPRIGWNLQATTSKGDFDDGDDLLTVDPTANTVTGRIDLHGQATAAGVLAAPGRIAQGNERLYVPLSNLSADFASAGPGRLVAIQAKTGNIAYVKDIPNAKNCAKAVWLASSARVAVVCEGFFGDGPDQTKFAQLVTFADDGSDSVQTAASALTLGGSGNAYKGPFGKDLVAIGSNQVAVFVQGNFDTNTPDALWRIDLSNGQGTLLAKAGAPFGLSGLSAFAKGDKQLLLAAEAANVQGDILVFDVHNLQAIQTLPNVKSNPGSLGAVDLGGF